MTSKSKETIFVTHWSDHHKQWGKPEKVTELSNNLGLPFGYFTAYSEKKAKTIIPTLPYLYNMNSPYFPCNFNIGESNHLIPLTTEIRSITNYKLFDYINHIKRYLRKDILAIFNNFQTISDMIEYLLAVEKQSLPPKPTECYSCKQSINIEDFFCKICKKHVCKDCFHKYTQHCIACEQ